MTARKETTPAPPAAAGADTEAQTPPLGGWVRVYAIVLGELALLILLFTLFARAFS
jgi:hypothetical protein